MLLRNVATMKKLRAWKIAPTHFKAGIKIQLHRKFELAVMAAAFTAMYCAYVAVFWVAQGESFAISAGAGLRNIGAIIPMAVIVRYLVRGPLRALSFPFKFVAHILIACLVSLSWYTIVLFMVNWSPDWIQLGISVLPFSSKATYWHLFQGLVVYAGLVAATYAFQLRDEVIALQAQADQLTTPPASKTGMVFVKSGDEFVKLDHKEIISVFANNDHVVIRTRHRHFRSNKKLKDLDHELQGFGFIRAHRSYLVNLAMIRSAEPTGDGRLTLHLANNESIISSRAGAKRFREGITN